MSNPQESTPRVADPQEVIEVLSELGTLVGKVQQRIRTNTVPPAFFDAQNTPEGVFPPSWKFEVREEGADRGLSGIHYKLYASHGGQEILIGDFRMEELAAGLVCSLRDIEGFGGDLPLLMLMAPTRPVEWVYGPWKMKHGGPEDRGYWSLDYGEWEEVAVLRDVGGMIPALLFNDLGHLDPETPKTWAEDYERHCREEYFEQYTEDPVVERLFRFLHQLEAETGKNLYELVDIDEVQFAAGTWQGRLLPKSDRAGAGS